MRGTVDADIPDTWKRYGEAIWQRGSVEKKALEYDPAPTPSIFDKYYVYFYTTHVGALNASELQNIWSNIIREDLNNEQTDAANFIRECLDFKLSRGYCNTDIISLGYDCLPRTVSARWGLKRTRAFGEKSHPFDLAVTPIGCIADILSVKFEDFFDDLDFDVASNHVVSRNHGILFNHEIGNLWVDDDFRLFKQRYSKRIANFLSALSNGRKTLFVIHLRQPLDAVLLDEIERIYIAAQSIGSNEKALLCIASEGVHLSRTPIAGLSICDVSDHPPGYEWWNYCHFVSTHGLAFEKKIAITINSLVR
ncbi:hypothetical protein [Methylosinus sp. PW1]|uniref:hypothetical protein n=1 Tax=Methylosinus sp. PW1 TaxID=107636 RepID=UPI000A07B524|nr:hypothetical protein [Methylosinus sp. PW1]